MSRSNVSALWRTQNFLHDPRLIERLVRRARIASDDVVYDLGAGSGNLTAAIARRAGRVVAIERDPRLVRRLHRRFAHQPSVVVCEADILAYPLPHHEYVVFASPPFDITAELMLKLTAASTAPRDAYLVLQEEAAVRFAGRPRMTLAAALIGPWFSLDALHRFAREDFDPRPSVDAVFVHLHKRGPPLVPERHQQRYRDFVVAAFTSRKATVNAALARFIGPRAARHLSQTAGIARVSYPSDLALGEWMNLYDAFARAPIVLRRRIAGSEARLRRQQGRLQKLHRTRAPRDALAGVATPPRTDLELAHHQGERLSRL